MENIVFDAGIREFQVNGSGVLRFNPGDLNVYTRFMESAQKIAKIEADMVKEGEKLKKDGTANVAKMLDLLTSADKKVKEVLRYVFGEQNDFDQIMGGVNCLSPASNGERVITNFLTSLQPILEDGAKKAARAQAATLAENARAGKKQVK